MWNDEEEGRACRQLLRHQDGAADPVAAGFWQEAGDAIAFTPARGETIYLVSRTEQARDR